MVPDVEREWITEELQSAPPRSRLSCLIWALLVGIGLLLLWIRFG